MVVNARSSAEASRPQMKRANPPNGGDSMILETLKVLREGGGS
jgi:hypothetical protein